MRIMDAVNREVLVIPMIETVESLKNMGEILSVPGIDVLLEGPSDLSINLGIALDYLNPKYGEALGKIAAACKKAGVIPGMYFIPGGQDPNSFVERGFKYFTLPWNKWAANGIQSGLETRARATLCAHSYRMVINPRITLIANSKAGFRRSLQIRSCTR